MLASLNNLIYAHKVGQVNREAVESIIPSYSWIDFNDINVFFVTDGGVESILDEDLKLIKAEETDVMLITASGMIIRSHADEISKIGRNGQGVRIMKLRETAGNRVVAVTIAPRYEEPAEEIKDEPEESAIVTAETVETPVAEVESEEMITDTVTDGDAE